LKTNPIYTLFSFLRYATGNPIMNTKRLVLQSYFKQIYTLKNHFEVNVFRDVKTAKANPC